MPPTILSEAYTPESRNVISGSARDGVGIGGIYAAGNQIVGNYVGVDATGRRALPNALSGIRVHAGKQELIQGNVVSGNRQAGIELAGGTTQNLVQGNWIGTDVSRTRAIGNGTSGVVVLGDDTVSNGIVANSIAFNGRLGIDLNGDGVTPNDHGDQDSGPNGLQNFPELYVLPNTGQVDQVCLQVELDSRPGRLYRIDVFASRRSDLSGYGEGQRPVGEFPLWTDDSGFGVIVVYVQAQPGEWLTATATSVEGTSEFSQAVPTTRRDVLPGLLVKESAGATAIVAGRTFQVTGDAPGDGGPVTESSDGRASAADRAIVELAGLATRDRPLDDGEHEDASPDWEPLFGWDEWLEWLWD